ncbi:MAG TPA: hypothetical protein VN950_22870 [Terriglobales bacterium]|nr:hypothetical protein [Terriglobales bacterium]
MIKKLLLFIAVVCSCAYAQRWDLGGPIAGVVTVSSGPIPYLITIPNVQLNWCEYPANSTQGSACTNYAPTYTDSTLSTPCSSTQPITLQGSNICQTTSDVLGNLGVWTQVGTYAYTLTSGSTVYGPFAVTIGGGGGGGGGITGATSGGGLVATGTTLGLLKTCTNGQVEAWNGTSWVCSGSLPVIIPPVVGDGTTDNASIFSTATASCPQTSTQVGCIIVLPCGHFYESAAWNIGLTKGMEIWGGGSLGTGGACTVIQTKSGIDGMIVGNGTTANSSGFILKDVAFQDVTGNGLSGIHIEATRDFLLTNVAAYGYPVGGGFNLDGGVNFTQFGTLINPYTWMTKYGIFTTGKTASITVLGGEFNCQNAGSTDVIAGSRGIDIGERNHTASTGTGSEWSVDVQSQNCEGGISVYNGGANKFKGKALENTVLSRGSNTFGVKVDGDTQSLTTGNTFEGIQVNRAAIGINLSPFANYTVFDPPPIFTGTNGVDVVEDANAYATTVLKPSKELTGWNTNVSACSRASNVVTCTTYANSDNGNLGTQSGTLLTLSNSTGGTTSFNGTFPATCSTNDATGVSTCTWSQTGANESATINPYPAGCNGAGTCLQPQSTVLNSGVGVLVITGEQITQNQTFQGVSNCPILGLSGTATTCFDGTYFDLIENNGGVLHLSDGPSIRLTGTTTNTYTPQPTTTAGYGVASVPNCSALLVPNPQTAVPCPSSDDKGKAAATNTNGTTVCLPIPGVANGYPPNYTWSPSFAPSTGPNYLSVTPPGQTSLYGQQCGGASGVTLDGLTAPRNLSIQQGVTLWTDGNNWFTEPGNPSIPLDQVAAALSNVNINLLAGSWLSSTSAGNNGGSIAVTGGNTNDSTGTGGNAILQTGHAPASGKNGSVKIIQTFEAGASTTGKEGSIARFCQNFSSDCSSGVLVQANAVRITISDSGDTNGAIGIVYAGSSIGNPTDIQIGGLYPTALTESSCDLTTNKFYLISQVSSSVNGRGYCSGTDGPLRVGLVAGATTGTCNTSTPCQVPILIAASGSGSGSTNFTAGGDLSGSNTSQEVTGILSHNLPTLAIGGLCWTGSALTWGSCSTSSITINNGTGITGGGTGSTFTLSLTAPAVLNNQVNTFGAFLQTFQGNILLTPGSDPGSPSTGQVWYATSGGLSYYDGTTKQRVMNTLTPVTLAQNNLSGAANGTLPYVTGGAFAALPIGGTGYLMNVTGSGLPGWNSNLVWSTGNLSVNGTVTATSFIGTGPYYLKTTYPSGSVTPTAGQSAFAVSSDTNWYLSVNGGTFGQIPFYPTGQVAADQIVVGLSAGVYETLTFPACADTGGNHLNYTHSGGITCGTSGGGGSGVITGYCDTTKATGANAGLRIAACLATSGVVVADASGETATLTFSTSLTMTSTTGQVVILPPATIVEGSGNTINISGNHNIIECNEWRSCTLDGSTNGALGTVNITSGKDSHILGVAIKGGSLTNQAGTEVTMSGAYHTFEHGSVDFAGSFGVSQANCYRCKTIDSHFNHSVKAAWGVNTGTINLSAMSGSGTLATATTSAASLVGSTGNQMQVAVGTCSDTTYNGQFQATSTGTTSFTYNTLTSVVSGSPTGCTYTVPSVGNEFLDNKGANNNTVDTGDAEVGITSSGGLGLTDGTIIRGNYFYNDLPVCNGDTTGATALAVTSIVISGTTATATVPINPNLITSPVASTVVIAGATTTGGSINGNQTIVTASSTQFTFTTSVGSQTATGTITYVVAGHGTNAHGCSEMYQMTDKATATEFAGNEGLNSWREMFATSGTGNRIHDNKCVNPNAINGGNGCFMMSVTHNGGLETQGYFGDSTFTHNTAVLTNSLTTPYCYSIQLGTGVTNIVEQNIVIADNICDSTGGGSFAQGIRNYDPSTAGTLTITNVDFHDNQMFATAPTQFSVTGGGVTVVGAPRSANNSTGTPTCTFTSGGGTSPACTLDTGSSDTSGIIIATTGSGSPAGTGTITLTFTVPQGYNKPSCTYTASDAGAGAWNGIAVLKDKTPTTASDLFTWTNGTTPTALTASTAYWLNYHCGPK